MRLQGANEPETLADFLLGDLLFLPDFYKDRLAPQAQVVGFVH